MGKVILSKAELQHQQAKQKAVDLMVQKFMGLKPGLTEKDIRFISERIYDNEWNPSVADCMELINDCRNQGMVLTLREYQLISAKEFKEMTGLEETDMM